MAKATTGHLQTTIRSRLLRELILCLMGLFISDAVSADEAVHAACERYIAKAAARHHIPEGILYAVGLTETGRGGTLHPYALNIDGRTVYARSLVEAMVVFERAWRSGHRFIDLGCMQINHHYHGGKFVTLRDMLNPARNVDYAADLLAELKQRHDSWTMAVARYHAGPNNDPAQRRYVCRVIGNLAATGYGRWTTSARAFCNNNQK